MPTNIQNGMTDARQWLKGVWPAAFAQGLEAMLGAKVEFDCLPIEDVIPEGLASDSWWQAEFSSTGGVSLWIGCPAQVADQIGRAALTAAGVSEASLEDAKGTYHEILGQSLSAVAQGLSRELTKDVASINGRECRRPMETAFVLPVKMSFTLGKCGPLWLAASREFDMLFTPAVNASSSPLIKSEQQQGQPKTMDLLFDVELPVSVSFGRTQLPLKDAIKLTTGSIVELNRSIMEPVEIIVNNCVIARGEVVVIEGNYGVRILQIMSRQERIRTLH